MYYFVLLPALREIAIIDQHMTAHIFTDSNFQAEVLQSTVPVLVDFWAEWCPPCKIIAPVMDELAKEYGGQVIIGKMNADENTQIPGQFTVMSLPTVMIFKNGQPIQALVGAKSKQTYMQEIENALHI
jgi:thioredoxin 1